MENKRLLENRRQKIGKFDFVKFLRSFAKLIIQKKENEKVCIILYK